MTEHEPLLLHLTLDSDDGPAERLDAAALDGQVAQVLAAHRGELRVAASAGRGSRRGQRRTALWLGAAAALVLSSAAAALWLGGGAQPEPALEGSGTLRTARPAPLAVATPEPSAPAVEAPAVEDTADAAPSRARTPSRSAERTPDLMARANALRAENKYRAAQELYLQVADAPGDSLSAHVALVAAGDLGLKLREPTRARRSYERALSARSDGPLAAEAWLGVAASHRAEGQRAAERQALETLLQRHATGPAATRARQRLGELDAPR